MIVRGYASIVRISGYSVRLDSQYDTCSFNSWLAVANSNQPSNQNYRAIRKHLLHTCTLYRQSQIRNLAIFPWNGETKKKTISDYRLRNRGREANLVHVMMYLSTWGSRDSIYLSSDKIGEGFSTSVKNPLGSIFDSPQTCCSIRPG